MSASQLGLFVRKSPKHFQSAACAPPTLVKAKPHRGEIIFIKKLVQIYLSSFLKRNPVHYSQTWCRLPRLAWCRYRQVKCGWRWARKQRCLYQSIQFHKLCTQKYRIFKNCPLKMGLCNIYHVQNNITDLLGTFPNTQISVRLKLKIHLRTVSNKAGLSMWILHLLAKLKKKNYFFCFHFVLKTLIQLL